MQKSVGLSPSEYPKIVISLAVLTENGPLPRFSVDGPISELLSFVILYLINHSLGYFLPSSTTIWSLAHSLRSFDHLQIDLELPMAVQNSFDQRWHINAGIGLSGDEHPVHAEGGELEEELLEGRVILIGSLKGSEINDRSEVISTESSLG